jgi:Transglutaminase-like superfamily
MRAVDLGAATVGLLAARLCLRAAPGPAIKWATEHVAESPSAGTPDAITRAVLSVGARMRASCLDQGLAVVMLLTVARIPSRLVIGVSRPGSAFAAHAWVECRGRIIVGAGQAADFVPLPPASASPCRG